MRFRQAHFQRYVHCKLLALDCAVVCGDQPLCLVVSGIWDGNQEPAAGDLFRARQRRKHGFRRIVIGAHESAGSEVLVCINRSTSLIRNLLPTMTPRASIKKGVPGTWQSRAVWSCHCTTGKAKPWVAAR
ncbi:MAG: hypothetical protein KatS3mg058_1379 [Roseiflexus sp.]|nr:MAG: hypothetical protein KatS3mg058_1379 [Roseiflexus sp.]